MKTITHEEVKAIGILNNKLRLLEASIKNRGLEESQRAIEKVLTQEHNINGYELDVEISMHSKSKELICRWYKDLKPLYLLDNEQQYNCKLANSVNYNATLNLYDNNKLHQQKHCWLLHSLYHEIGLSFENILNIEYVWFDIKVKYQYVENL